MSMYGTTNSKGIAFRKLFSLEMTLSIHKKGFIIPKPIRDCTCTE